MLNKTLRVLNVEDSEPDVALLTRHLTAAGYEIFSKRVETDRSMKAALEAREWDVVLCDYSMPRFDALKALQVLRRSGLDIPFIIISGTVGEDIAVKAMLTGADDYLPKDNLTRLVPAIERELREAQNRRLQRETEEARRLTEQRYRALFEYAPDGIIISSPESYYLDANAGMCRMLGYSHGELIGMHASDIVTEAEVKHIDEAMDEIQAEADYHREWQFRRKDRSVFIGDVMVTTMPDGNLMAIIRDVTDIKRAEDERRIISEIIQGVVTTRNLDEFLKLVHRSIGQIVYAENCIVMLHDPATDTFRYDFWADKRDPPPPPKPVGKGFGSLVLRSGRPLLLTKELKKELVDRGEAILSGTPSLSWVGIPLRTQAATIGVLVLQHYELENIFTERDLEFLSSVGDQIALAIERKRAEDGLRESEYLLSASQRITHQGSWVIDLSGSDNSGRSKERWSDEHYRIFGFEPGQVEITDEIFYNSVHPDDRDLLSRTMREAIEQHKPFNIEHRIILPDGSERVVQAQAELVFDVDTGQPLKLLGSIQDITDRKHLEEQFRQSQKMEAVGALAGGIAHDFNNLLTAINGYSDLTLRKMSADEPLRNNIREIKEAGERAAELTSQLLAFSRKQVLKPRVYNLNAAITEIDRMLRRIMRESIELRTALDPDLGNIKADAGQIEQVIMNLAVNARDAMPDGGTLTIETKNVHLDEAYVSQHLMISPGSFVRMTVTDTGHGMDEEVQRHIFEPFFTTKDVGKGTGLGLSTVYGIIKQSGGDIMVYSEVGHGTTFKIYLPCVDQPVEKPKWVGDNVEKYSGTETILLVEDEEIVRNLVCEILTGNGYTVLEAANGKAALSLCNTYSEPIDMLLTDVVMPKMSGNELRDLVVKLHPEIKVLFMSGYTDDAMAHRGLFDSHNDFIEKPFMPDGLSRKVREVLEY